MSFVTRNQHNTCSVRFLPSENAGRFFFCLTFTTSLFNNKPVHQSDLKIFGKNTSLKKFHFYFLLTKEEKFIPNTGVKEKNVSQRSDTLSNFFFGKLA